NTSDGLGGALYNTSSQSIVLTIENTTFSGNHANVHGGAIYLDADQTTTLTILNSTIQGNTATNHGAGIYNSAGTGSTVYIIDSTIAGNYGSGQGAGIYSTTGSGDHNVYSIGNIIYANYQNTDANDLYLDSANLHAIHSVYGTMTQGTLATDINNTQLTTTQENVESVFTTVTTSNNRYLPQLSEDGKTIAIQASGAGAYSGTLIGQKDGEYFWYDYQLSKSWHSIASDATYEFDRTDTVTYGLIDDTSEGIVYTIAQNEISRVLTLLSFNAGSYALNSVKAPSLHVTTDIDNLNPFGGLNSLRDALGYAAADIDGDLLVDGAFTITFDESIFENNVCTITAGYEMLITGAVAGQKLVLDVENGKTLFLSVTEPGTSE
ncbi:MAG TPA: hypothetical protein PLR86_11785, partial [Planctomycetota bacterium]|nr:hypothetical protein [Planctomycetota bacterium]